MGCAKKDFFISYTKADRHWAEWIASNLEQAGYSIIIQAWDFHAGKNFILEMHRATLETRRTIAVYSARYQKAFFTQTEWAAVLVQDPDGKKRLLIPILIEEVKPAGLLAPLIYIDLFGLSEDEAKRHLIRQIGFAIGRESARPHIPPPFPVSPKAKNPAHGDQIRYPCLLPPIWKVPYQRNPNFTGREEVLDTIHSSFGPTSRIQALYGLGGVGKTQIAVEYCYRYSDSYEMVWWLRSEDILSLATDYVMLAEEKALNLAEQNAQEQAVIINAVIDQLNHRKNWLLVFDNAKDYQSIANYLPQSVSGSILVTSRNSNWRQGSIPHRITAWPRRESIVFLHKRTGVTNIVEANKVSEALGDLPLALEQAGAYIESSGICMSDYLELFNKQRKALWHEEVGPLDHEHTVEVTIGVSIVQASKMEPLAEEILKLCAVIAPDAVPKSLMKASFQFFQDSRRKGIENSLVMNRAIGELKKYSLITLDQESLSLHRLVQTVVRDRMDIEVTKEFRAVMLKALNEQFPSEGYSDPSCWSRCEKLMPHIEVLLKWILNIEMNEACDWMIIINLLNGVEGYLHGRGEFLYAEIICRKVLKIRLYFDGNISFNVSTSLNDLAVILRDQAKYKEARELFSESLNIRKELFGDNHVEVAFVKSNLAELLRSVGHLNDAYLLHMESLKTLKILLGEKHLHVATCINQIGLVLSDLGECDEAERFYSDAIEIYIKELGPLHSFVATSQNNLGLLLIKKKNYKKAMSVLFNALEIRRKNLGENHTDYATNLYNIAQVFMGQGDFTQARKYFDDALVVKKRNLRINHPDIIKIRRGIADILCQENACSEALIIYDELRKYAIDIFGDEHRDVEFYDKKILQIKTIMCKEC